MNAVKLVLVSLGLLALTACITPVILLPIPGINCANDRGTEEKYKLPACKDLERQQERESSTVYDFAAARVVSGKEVD